MTSETAAEEARIRGYLQSQGERFTHPELWPRAVKARLELLDALEGVTEEQASWSPSADEWSIKEVALHVLNGSRSTRRVVQELSAGQRAGASGIEPPREPADATIEALRAGLRDDGLAWAAAVVELPERPATEPTAPHPMFGQLHARAFHLFQRVHDLDHMRQIEAVKQAERYPSA